MIATAARVPAAPARPSANDLTVLIVAADGAGPLAAALTEAGHAVRVVPDGAAATAAAADRPDVLLVDGDVPGAGGWAVARRVRAAPSGRGCFVIAASAAAGPADRQRSRAAGVDLHLTKPADVATLVGLLVGCRLS